MDPRVAEDTRRVLILAHREAGLCGSSVVATEHLLLGLLDPDIGPMHTVLDRHGLRKGPVRRLVSLSPPGATRPAGAVTPRAQRALDLAREEARSAGDHHVRPDHLLLGIIREGGGHGAYLLLAAADEATWRADIEKLRPTFVVVEDNLTRAGPRCRACGDIAQLRRRPAVAVDDEGGDQRVELTYCGACGDVVTVAVVDPP